MSLLELAHLQKTYGSVKALQDLSLDVPEGCLYGLLGPNGAGKTTTLRILATLLAPDAGIVRVAGIDALQDPRAVRSLMGYVAQEVAIDKILTGRELLQLQGDLYHLRRADRDQRMEELIAILGMHDWIDRRCGTYSGGMRRRLDLASGLLHRPRLLVLDEPTVGLHARDIEQLVGVMHRLRDLGNTIVVVEHEQVVMEAADHLIDLGPGAGQHDLIANFRRHRAAQ